METTGFVGWQVVPCLGEEGRFLLVRYDNDPVEYMTYELEDLVDGTFLEVPRGTFGNLLMINPDGAYETGPLAELAERSYFLQSMVVDGTPHRVLEGIIGDRNRIDSFLITDSKITCRIIPSEATHPIEERQRRTGILF